MTLYSMLKKGIGIMALAGAISYIGGNTLESRVFADEPRADNGIQLRFRGRTPKNAKEAIEQMYSYAFDADNFSKVIDLGRDNANGYFASLGNDRSSDMINGAFDLLKKEYLVKAKKYLEVFGREIDQDFIKSTEFMIKKLKDNQLKTYLLMNLVDTTQSLEEFTRRVQDIDSIDHELAYRYKIAENKLNLRLIPGGVEYWFGTATKAEVDKLMAQVSGVVHPIHAYSQIPGSGWKTREESVLIGAFELIDPEKGQTPVVGFGLNSLRDKVKIIAKKQGFNEEDLVSVIKEEEWEQAARGSKTKRYSIYGSMDHLKMIAEINDVSLDDLFNIGTGNTFLSASELKKQTPLDKSPYGLIGLVGNCIEFTEGKAKRKLNTTPSDDERTADSVVTQYDGDFAIDKGGGLKDASSRYLVWSVGISNRSIVNDSVPSSPGGVYLETTRMRVAFPKKLKEVASKPPSPPNPPETRTADPGKKPGEK